MKNLIIAMLSDRSYCGDIVFEDEALLYANFAGGYFDGDGQPHYRRTDFQGNVTMVTDGSGQLDEKKVSRNRRNGASRK